MKLTLIALALISFLSTPALLDSAWTSLSRFWAPLGCKLDPDGNCIPTSPQPDIGCKADPSGNPTCQGGS
jgi:hypothetical protein